MEALPQLFLEGNRPFRPTLQLTQIQRGGHRAAVALISEVGSGHPQPWSPDNDSPSPKAGGEVGVWKSPGRGHLSWV